MLVALPDLQMLIRLAHKQNLPLLLLRRIREQHQHTLLLLDARKKKQIRIRFHWQRAIRIRRQHIIRIQNRQRLRRHERGNTLAVLRKQLRFNQLVSHINRRRQTARKQAQRQSYFDLR